MSEYSGEAAAAFYDDYADREWTRFEDGRSSPVSFEIHRHYLHRFIRRRDRVIDVGAGPGRSTIELVRIGARVTVVDISPTQLRQNEERFGAAAGDAAVEERVLADVLDLSRWPAGAFDATRALRRPHQLRARSSRGRDRRAAPSGASRRRSSLQCDVSDRPVCALASRAHRSRTRARDRDERPHRLRWNPAAGAESRPSDDAPVPLERAGRDPRTAAVRASRSLGVRVESRR
jgi:SAM-dependent methyltransferase